MSRIPIRIKNGNHVFHHRLACVFRHVSCRESRKSPAFRPSHPHGCRNRALSQAHALRGRLAGLDVHALASGLIHSRATDEEASGGGSVKGSSQAGSTKTAIQKAFPAAHGFFAYRHMVQTIHANPSRCMLHRVFPIHIALPPTPRSDTRAVMCAMLAIVGAGY